MSQIRPFKRQDSYAAVPWLVAFMVMLATLCLGFALNVENLTQQMRGQHVGHVTLYWAAQASMDEQQAVFDFLDKAETVQQWRYVPRPEVLELLKPWLGDDAASTDMPVPIMVDVVMKQPAQAGALGDDLADMVPNFSLVEHQAWLADFIQLLEMLRLVAVGLVGFIAIVGGVMVVKATRTELSLHFDTVDLLRYLGANKRYIASQFRHSALRMSLRGVLAGGVLCGVALWLLQAVQVNDTVVFGALLQVTEAHGWLLLAVMLGWLLFMSWLAGHAVMRRIRLCA